MDVQIEQHEMMVAMLTNKTGSFEYDVAFAGLHTLT